MMRGGFGGRRNAAGAGCGNTNTVIGVFNGKSLLQHWRLSTRREGTSDEYAMLSRALRLRRAYTLRGDRRILSSVVPPLQWPLREYGPPLLRHGGPGGRAGHQRQGCPSCTSRHGVGADRIVNAVAAFEAHGGPCIVVDFGTATTFDAVSARGEYMGGVICPGISISAEALFQHAAKLPRVDINKTKAVIGRNTVRQHAGRTLLLAILAWWKASSCVWRAELGPEAKAIATGGLAQLSSATRGGGPRGPAPHPHRASGSCLSGISRRVGQGASQHLTSLPHHILQEDCVHIPR